MSTIQPEQNKTLQAGTINFLNYFLSKGPIEKVVTDSKEAAAFTKAHIPFEAASKFRQQLGGVFTTYEQILSIPGIDHKTIEELTHHVRKLDLRKLEALSPKTTWNNQVEAFINGPECLELLVEEIKKAQRYIHFSVMLFFNDTSGTMVSEALLDALSRGVQVRLMVDFGVTAIGYEKSLQVGDFQKIADRLTSAGCKIVNTFHNCYPKDEWPQKRKELKEKGVPESTLCLQDYVQEEYLVDLNVINHRKFMVIDGKTSIVGSLNIGDQYTYDTPVQQDNPQGVPREEGEWQDGCFRIRGAAAQSLNEVFAFQWTVLGGDVYKPGDSFYQSDEDLNFGREECTIISSFPGNPVNLIQQYYLSLISYAGDEAVIINPYLIDQAFWDELKSLPPEQAGRITICNPLYVNDHLTNRPAVKSNMYKPFENGVSFFDYSHTGRFSHWKISYDKRANAVFHGSYNINERSACHDFELGVLVKGKEFASSTKNLIDGHLAVSKEIKDSSLFFKYPLLHPSTYANLVTKKFT